MRRHLLSAAALALTASLAAPLALAESGAAAKTTAGKATPKLSAGIALEYVEPAVRAQDDFFQHLNGKWLKTVEIPSDKSSWGAFYKLRDDTQPQLRAIIEKSAAVKNPQTGSEVQLIGDFFASYMDEARLEQLGITPLNSELAKIAAIKDKAELPVVFARLGRLGVNVPFSFYIHQDAKDSTKYVADLYQGGLGMPDRDYYLKTDDAKLADTRAKYQQHVEKMLALSGDKNAAANAKAIVDLETELARVQWTKVENRDPIKTYNKVELAKLAEIAPGYDWNAWLGAAGIGGKTDYVIVSQPSYLKGMAEIVNRVPLETWKVYLQQHLVNGYASYLSKAFVDQRFAFHGTVLSGAPKLEPRWKRGVSTVEGALGDAVGKLYVKEHFPAERKVRMEALVKNLLEAYRQSIDTLDWMSPATKKEAQAKLAKFNPKIGYPNKWKDYSSLSVKRDDLVGNVMRSREVEYNRELNKLGKPIDRDEWMMTPQTVNAYYNPELNEIVFPAAILQPPFYDPKASDAHNYGAIGSVIGHEISHSFDDMGAQFDAQGRLRDWWTKEDLAHFRKASQKLVEQYNAYKPFEDLALNGQLTLSENLSDLAGLAAAYDAFKALPKGKNSGPEADRAFFTGFAQSWRTKMREASLRRVVLTDGHSPGQYRTYTVRNLDAWYKAFDVQPGQKLYLAPEQRVRVW